MYTFVLTSRNKLCFDFFLTMYYHELKSFLFFPELIYPAMMLLKLNMKFIFNHMEFLSLPKSVLQIMTKQTNKNTNKNPYL